MNNTFECRHYGHWATNAKKARFSAHAAWKLSHSSELASLLDKAEISETQAKLSLAETFRRESAIALELIVKAVIARRLELNGANASAVEGRVPPSHDLPILWKKANLPNLPEIDQYRLLLFKSILYWSGRYSTPKSDDVWEKENENFSALEKRIYETQNLGFRKPIIVDWDNFDRLFQIAESAHTKM